MSNQTNVDPWNYDSDPEMAGGSGGGLYLDLPQDGDSAQVVFRGSPQKLRGYWDAGQGFTVNLADGEEPPEGHDLKIQFKINVYNVDTNTTQIMKLNAPTFRQVSDFRADEGADFDRMIIKIKRTGTGKKTRYQLSGRGLLNDTQAADMAAQQLHELTA